MHSDSMGDGFSSLGGTIVLGFVLMAIAMMIVALWIIIRCTNLVLRVCTHWPCAAMWIALAIFFASAAVLGFFLLFNPGLSLETWLTVRKAASVFAGLASIGL